jgi:hypothetical protein
VEETPHPLIAPQQFPLRPIGNFHRLKVAAKRWLSNKGFIVKRSADLWRQ